MNIKNKFNKPDLCFYETPEWVSNTIANKYKSYKFDGVIDLGSGKGSIQKAFKKVYRNKKTLVSIDVNDQFINEIITIGSKFYKHNILSSSINTICGNYSDNRSIFVSNPPFGLIKNNRNLRRLMANIGFIDDKSQATCLRKELVFLARTIEAAQKGSPVAFIMPYSILVNESFRQIRRVLVDNHYLHEIFVLPENIFPKTEVKTAVLFFKINKGKSKKIKLTEFETNFELSKLIESERIVNGIYAARESKSTKNKLKLGDICEKLIRGRSCLKEIRRTNTPFIHSTHIYQNHAGYLYGDSMNTFEHNYNEKIAKKGDIVLARVGSRCVASVAMIKSGKMAITDSVIKINVPNKMRNHVFQRLSSNSGQKWLLSNLSGSCAKILTYSSLERFPL